MMTINDTLEKIIDNRGKTPPISSSGHCLLEINSIAGKQKHPNYEQVKKYVNDEIYNVWFRSGHPQKGDILIPTVGTLDAIAVMDRNDCCIAQNMIAFRTNPCICNSEFLYYYLCNPIVRKRLLNLNIGGVQPSIKVPHLKNLEIDLPDIKTQLQIASLLGYIDQNITNNERINDNLFQQAMALFVQAFVSNSHAGNFMPLYDFADFINGAAFKSAEYSDSGLPIIKIAELKNGITDSTQYFNGDKGEKYIIYDKDILFSWSGNPDTSIDTYIWCDGKAILNQHTFNVISKEGTKWFVFLMLKYFKPQFTHIASNKQTTGLGHVTSTDLKRLTFPHDLDRIIEFEKTVTPFMESIFDNMMKNKKLAILRDSLIPQLMSGKVDVSSITV